MTTVPSADYQAALEFLWSRIDYERAAAMPYSDAGLRLDRMRTLLSRLGNPQAGLPIVHVAGTKGKGSTAAMLAAMFTAAGIRTGLYSSPHLERIEERVAIDGQICDPGAFARLVQTIEPVVRQMDTEAVQRSSDERADYYGPTYFEIVTALALRHYADQQVQMAVLEVGLGGRLDSTNVCQPRVSVITSISLDHTRQLGSTLAAIAGEKAGIIKPGVPVVCGVREDEPRAVIAATARRLGSPLVQAGVDFDHVYRPPRHLEVEDALASLDYLHPAQPAAGLRDVSLRLIGRHQAANAAVALAVTEQLAAQGWSLPEAALRAGLAVVRWPARVEVLARRPAVVIDGAHNVASVEALLTVLDESFQARRRLLVFAAARDKDAEGMLGRLGTRFDGIVVTRFLSNPRAIEPAHLADIARHVPGAPPVVVCDEPAAAWQAVRAAAAADDLIVATGSLFLAGELRSLLHGAPQVGAPLESAGRAR